MLPQQIFNVASFSTNFEDCPPFKILKVFFKATVCNNIFYSNNFKVTFDHSIQDTICHTNFTQISNLAKNHNSPKVADCLLIFVDMEVEASYENLETIILYLKNNCKITKKVYILGIYSNKSNIKDELKEESILELIKSKDINYDYLEVNIDNGPEIGKIFDFIIQEFFEKKKGERNDSQNELPENDMSKSNCEMF